MTPHIHLGLVEAFFATFLPVIVLGAMWRLVAIKLGDRPIARAMLFAY